MKKILVLSDHIQTFNNSLFDSCYLNYKSCQAITYLITTISMYFFLLWVVIVMTNQDRVVPLSMIQANNLKIASA